MNNAVPFPHEEREAGRPTERVSMIHDQLLEVRQISFFGDCTILFVVLRY